MTQQTDRGEYCTVTYHFHLVSSSVSALRPFDFLGETLSTSGFTFTYTQIQTETGTYIYIYTDRQRQIDTQTHRERHRDIQTPSTSGFTFTYIQIQTQIQRQTGIYIHTDRQTHRERVGMLNEGQIFELRIICSNSNSKL